MRKAASFTPLKRVISYVKQSDSQPKGFEAAAHLSGSERVRLQEELRFEISTVTGDDYSQKTSKSSFLF
jgi:hypothetical protein